MVGVSLCACGTDSGDSAESTVIEPATPDAGTAPPTGGPVTSAATRALVEFRPVFQCQSGALTSSSFSSAPVDPTAQEVLPTADGLQICLVGPARANQEVLDLGSAQAALDFNQQWVVTVDFRPDGQAAFDAMAQQCFDGTEHCPSHQIAIVVDGVIQSAPTVQTPNFPGTMQIAGAFTEDEVRALAKTLNGG